MIDLRKEVLAPSYSFEATELKILGGERVYTLATFDHLGREIARQDIRLKPNAAENLDTLVEEIVTRNGEREIAILRKRSGTGRFTLHSTLVRGSASRLEPIGEGEEDDADLVDHTRKSSAKPSRKATEVSRPRDSEDRMEWIDQAVRESKNHKESMEERAEYRHKQSTFHNLHYEEILDLAEHELLLDTRTVPSLMSEEYSRLSATQEPRTTTKSVKFTGEETRSRGETQALSSQLPEELSERKASSPRRASSEAVPSEETYLNRFERKKSSVDSKQKRENSRERLSKKTSTTSLNPPQSSKVSKGVGAESLARESEASKPSKVSKGVGAESLARESEAYKLSKVSKGVGADSLARESEASKSKLSSVKEHRALTSVRAEEPRKMTKNMSFSNIKDASAHAPLDIMSAEEEDSAEKKETLRTKSFPVDPRFKETGPLRSDSEFSKPEEPLAREKEKSLSTREKEKSISVREKEKSIANETGRALSSATENVDSQGQRASLARRASEEEIKEERKRTEKGRGQTIAAEIFSDDDRRANAAESEIISRGTPRADPSEEAQRRLVREIFQQEKGKLSEELLRRIDEKKQNGNGGLLDEFYEFCQRSLPGEQKYKDSILYISLFYFFLEKKAGKI